MVEIVRSSAPGSTPEAVWAVLADFGEISRWAPNVDHSCLTTSEVESVGTVRRVQVGRSALLERVTVWEPAERLAYVIEGLPPVVRSVTNTWTIEPSGDGTAVTLTSRIDAGPRPPQRLVARVMGRALANASEQMLEGLTKHLEEEMA